MQTQAGTTYQDPTAVLLHASPLINAEVAGRTAYSSFALSEHEAVRNFSKQPFTEDIESSKLLYDLSHVYFHESVIEHVNLTYHLTTSRGALQELARHRIATFTVQSTRYTMSSVVNAFVASLSEPDLVSAKQWFIHTVAKIDLLVTTDPAYNTLEIGTMFDKFLLQYTELQSPTDDGYYEFFSVAVAKSSIPYLQDNRSSDEMFNLLEAGKKKRNVGDSFKHIVTDNWKVNLVMTMNLRSLKNFFQLRDSGAAYFQIRNLAKAMKQATPVKYLDLVIKPSKA